MRDNALPDVLWLLQRQVPAVTHQTPFPCAQVLCFKDHLQQRHLPRQGWHRVGSSAHTCPTSPEEGATKGNCLSCCSKLILSISVRKNNPLIIRLSFPTHAWRKLPPGFWGRGRPFMLREYQETWTNCLERTRLFSWKGRLTLPTAGRQLQFLSSGLC